MKRKIFSKLLMVALVIAAVSSFVSCKDYDDDINNLQKQIDAKAAISQIENLQTQLTKAQSDATAAQQSATQALEEAKKKTTDEAVKKAIDDAIAKVNAAAEKAATETAAEIKKAADAAKAAGDDAAAAKTAADEAKAAAEKAATDAAAAIKKAIEDANLSQYLTSNDIKDFLTKAQIEALISQNAQAKGDYVQASSLSTQLADLKTEILSEVSSQTGYVALDVYQAAIAKLYAAITSVSLYKADWSADENGLWHGGVSGSLNFVKVKEQENKFPTDAKKAEADNQYIFTKDKYVTYEDSIIVRVSPASATLTADMIELINSQGNTITSEVSIVKVARYNKLLTRAADGNGLWTITYKLKDGYDENAFLSSTVFDANEDGKLTPGAGDRNILFAVAVNNTKDEAADRRIVSEYDVTVNTANAQHAGYFTIKPANDENAEWIYNVHNRYLSTEAGDNTQGAEELVWKNEFTGGQYTGFTTVIVDNDNPANPAANAYTRKNADDLGLSWYRRDNRQGQKFIYADVNEAIEIEFTNAAARPLKGFYVTLDRDYALESIPSEINAWDSYSYTNVGTKSTPAHMIDGNKGVISVNSEVAKGDYIGFRVYAVNLDGTLVDPDGRAFYIHVGRLEDTTQKLAADVIADRITPTSKVAKTAVFDNTEDNNVRYVWNIKDAATDFPNDNLPNVNKINYVDKDGVVVATTTLGSWGYLSTANAKKVVGITVEFANIAQVYNDQTVTFEAKVYKRINAGGAWQDMEIGLVEAKITKKLAAFPTKLQGRAAQFTGADATDHFSGGTLNLFLLEDANDFTLASWTGAALANGSCDLVSAFYNLDLKDDGAALGNGIYDPANYEFTFATSDKNGSGALIDKTVAKTAGAGTSASKYQFAYSVDKGFIDNTTGHNTTVTYNYGAVSTYKKADGTLVYAEEYKPAKQFTTIYDCLWDTKWMSYAWKENKAANTPSFTVGDNGKSINMNTIYTTNAYNATVYGNAYKTITLADFATSLTFTGATLTSNETGVEDYFKCAIAGTVINLTPQEDWHNPVADVPSTLTIKYTDQFGHKETITLPVTVKKQ